MKSQRNKTIDMPVSEGEKYLKRCLVPTFALTKEEVCDKLLLCDFFESVSMLPSGFADLIIADPPYNLRKDYAGEVFGKKSSAEYKIFTENWVKEIKRLLKPHGTLYVCCDWQTSLIIGGVLDESFIVRNRITWEREKGRGALTNWKNSMEDIWFCTVSDSYKFNLDAVKILKPVIAPYTENGEPKDWQKTEKGNFRLTCPSNFWDDITVPFWSMPENTAHPAQKPEKLLARLILASSDEGDTVFDPFAGSGSTAVTAKKLSRHFTGIEKNPQYCVWAQLRLEAAEKDNTIQGMENGVFLPRNERKIAGRGKR